MKSDRDRVSNLEADWDRIVGREELPRKAPVTNPYDEKVQAEDDVILDDDNNLYTAYALLASFGFETNIGKMFAYYSEKRLPYTIGQLFTAIEATRGSNNIKVAEFKENLRGMTAMIYAWAYVMAKTGNLTVKDREIYQKLAELSSTTADSEERRRLTASAENKLEVTLGLLLQALDSAKKQNKNNLALFYIGSLQMLYSLSNATYGVQASFVESDNK